MAEKKFSTANGVIDTPELNSDYESAKVFDRLRVGSLGVYFRSGLKIRHIPYDLMDRAFIRIQETKARMCCGQANFDYFRMVFVHGGKEFADFLSENEEAMDEALAEIAGHGVATGFIKAEATA